MRGGTAASSGPPSMLSWGQIVPLGQVRFPQFPLVFRQSSPSPTGSVSPWFRRHFRSTLHFRNFRYPFLPADSVGLLALPAFQMRRHAPTPSAPGLSHVMNSKIPAVPTKAPRAAPRDLLSPKNPL